MSIKSKIILPMIVLTLIIVASVLGSNVYQFTHYVDASMEDRVSFAAKVAAHELETLKAQANTASLYIAENEAVIDAIESGHRDALLVLLKQLEDETGIDLCTITNDAGIVMVRSHNTERYGDDLSTRDYIRTALSGKTFSAISEGSDVPLSARSGVPVYNGQGGIIGVVSAGFRLDNNLFVDSIKALLGCEATVFLGDERLSTTVVKEDGSRAVGTKAAANVSKMVLAGGTYSGQSQILNRDALTRYMPIHGADGSVKGMLFVGRYMEEKAVTVWSFIRVGAFITLALLGVCVLVFLTIVKRIVFPLTAVTNFMKNAGATGDITLRPEDVETIGKYGTGKDEICQCIGSTASFIKRVIKISGHLETIASGNLTDEITLLSTNDTMGNSLKMMMDNLNGMFAEINASTLQVSTGSRQIADGAQSLAQGSTEQASAIEELSSSIGSITGKTKENADIAREAANLSGNIKGSAEKGAMQMEHMMQAVEEINSASAEIERVIKVIDDIAFQTNILALNAAVEASRAGNAGRGFAVVAEEVRNLAAKSAEAAKDTGGLIKNSVAKANLGLSIAKETSASLNDIVEGINRSAEIVELIANSSDEQADAIAHINTSIDQVAQIVRQNSATAEESAAASIQMSGQSENLQQLMSQFRLRNSDYYPALPSASPAHHA